MVKDASEVVERLALDARPEDVSRLDRQFADKLARLEDDGHLGADTLADLRLFWHMLKAPEEVVPWADRALVMAALAYFVAPLDAIPDLAGRAGYLDDAQVVRLVRSRVAGRISAFEAWRGR